MKKLPAGLFGNVVSMGLMLLMLLVTGVMLLATGCGGGASIDAPNAANQQVTSNDGSINAFNLALPADLKSVSIARDAVRHGMEYMHAADYPRRNVIRVDTKAMFSPNFGETSGIYEPAYAVYVMDVRTTEQDGYISFIFSKKSDNSNAWVGLADYGKHTWDWMQLPQDDMLDVSFIDYADEDGRVAVALVFTGYDQWELEEISVGPESSMYTVEGLIVDGDDFLPYVPLEFEGHATFSTHVLGDFDFWIRLPNGVYTVTPDIAGWTFSPETMQIEVNGSDMRMDTIYAYKQPTYEVDGHILLDGDIPRKSMDMSITGDAEVTTGTNFEGWWLTELPAGEFTFTPSHYGYEFQPESMDYTVGNGPLSIASFNATKMPERSISFNVKDVDGYPLEAIVQLMAGDHRVATLRANEQGFFQYDGLVDGEHTVQVWLSGYAIWPEYVEITVDGSNVYLPQFTGMALPIQ